MDRLEPAASPRGGWTLAACLLAAYWAAVLVVFAGTALTIEATWARSDTFAHGYLILPIAIWLVFRRRDALARISPRGSVTGALMVLPAALAWVVASLVEVQVVQQLALVAMLLAGTWAILGTPVTREIAFPLGFVFLAVPMGEGLIPPMQAFTASATVRMVELSGVPVYREGMQISLPSGNWRVVEACSGVRYLIASVTLGLLYAYLSYRQWWRRLLFIALSFVVPIVANALRAYMIVMIGHLSNGRLAAGVDHLIYGWVFFGLVMLLLFWLGSLWMEDTAAEEPHPNVFIHSGRRPLGVALGFVVSALLVTATPPVFHSLEASVAEGAPEASRVALPAAEEPWSRASGTAPVALAREGADQEHAAMYSLAQQSVYLELLHFPPRQQQGAESVVDYRRLFATEVGPDLIGTGEVQVALSPDRTLAVTEIVLRRGADRLRVWYWYRVGDRSTGNPYLVKTYETLQRLAGDSTGTRRLVLMAPEPEGQSAAAAMQTFLRDHWQALAGED